MKKIIQAVIEKLIADNWITVNEQLNKDALNAFIVEAIRDIKVKDFLDAFDL